MAGAKNLAGELLDRAIERGWGERPALEEGGRVWSYRELRDFSARLARGLSGLGLEPGARVAVVMPDSAEAVASILGAVYAGLVAVPVSELGRPSDLRDYLNDSGAEIVIVRDQLAQSVDEVSAETLGVREIVIAGDASPGHRSLAELSSGEPLGEAVAVDADATALLLYSAGIRESRPLVGPDPAAGALVGVPHRHETPLRAYESLAAGGLGFEESDRVFSVVRVSSAYGLGSGALFPLAAGCRAILLSEQPTSDRVFSVVRERSPTALIATPSLYRQLALDAEAQGVTEPLAGLRLGIAGAEEMPAQVLERASRILGAELTVGYGSTEAFQFVLAGRVGGTRAGACGTPLPGFEVRIVDDAGGEVGADEIGALQIRAPTLVHYYWGEPRAGEGGDGWFATRDRFLVDGDGHYYHCGRADDLFKVGGRWLAPAEVERALIAHEAVWECAVIGTEDADGLTVPVAFVVPNIGHTPGAELEDELRGYIKGVLSPYKYPRWVEFVDKLPRGPSGKLLRYKLRPTDRRRDSRP